MRVVVFAYHQIGCVCLEELLRQGHEVVAVVTHEDDPDEEIWFPSVPRLAREQGLPTYTPADPNAPEFVELIRDLQPDIAFSFYYRYMLKQPLLDLPARGFLNLHGSYLPAYRGRCPVNWVLVNGETETGVTLHYMVAKPDAGDIVAQQRVPIDFADTALTLYGKLTAAAQEMFAAVLPQLAAGTAPRQPMDLSRGSYYGGRKPQDGQFSWDWDAVRIYNLVRAVTHPYPGAFVPFAGGPLLVWGCRPEELETGGDEECPSNKPGTVRRLTADGPVVTTGKGGLLLLSVQPAGQPEMTGVEFSYVYGLAAGCDLSPSEH